MKIALTEFVTLDGVSGLVLLEYERVGAAPVAEYEGVGAFV